MCLSRCNTATQIYVVRFLVGLAESAFYPGMQYVIGSWYRKDELAKRSCIFHTSSALGTMFSGYLMAAVYHLGGVGGLKGWQWFGWYFYTFGDHTNLSQALHHRRCY
jgi:ACS family pantothenate transporter-like MFS transporter